MGAPGHTVAGTHLQGSGVGRQAFGCAPGSQPAGQALGAEEGGRWPQATHQSPAEDTAQGPGQLPSTCPYHSSTAYGYSGQRGLRHSGPRSAPRSRCQHGGLQGGGGSGGSVTDFKSQLYQHHLQDRPPCLSVPQFLHPWIGDAQSTHLTSVECCRVHRIWHVADPH